MNKFDIAKFISKTPLSRWNTTQEIIKLAVLIVATSLAYKVEDIVTEMMSEKNNSEFHNKEGY